VAQIAGTLGIPAGTVKSRLFHARERLRAAVEV
jgi:DNA-directed RNA polymerase specialized sigma24 family protein